MYTKLTLRLDQEIIAKVKAFTRDHRISLSKFTELLFAGAITEPEHQQSPLVKKYRGIIAKATAAADDEKYDRLIKKHS